MKAFLKKDRKYSQLLPSLSKFSSTLARNHMAPTTYEFDDPANECLPTPLSPIGQGTCFQTWLTRLIKLLESKWEAFNLYKREGLG